MNWNPATKWVSGYQLTIPYLNGGTAIAAGDVVIVDGVCCFALTDIAASVLGYIVFGGSLWQGNKATGAWTAGNPVYWNPAGTPVVASTSAGAFTQTYASGCYTVGIAVISPNSLGAAGSSDQYGYFVKTNLPLNATIMASAAVTATGSAAANAAPIASGLTVCSGGNGTAGFILPASASGTVCEVKNAAAAVLLAYPQSGGQINGTSSLSMAASTAATFICADGVHWYSFPLVPS